MEIEVKPTRLETEPSDAAIIFAFENEEERDQVTALDKSLQGFLRETIKDEDFKAKLGKTLVLHTHTKIPAKRVIVVGLGEPENLDAERVRRASAAALNSAKEINAKTITIPIPPQGNKRINAKEKAYALATGALLADYAFLKYQKEKLKESEKRAPKTLLIVDPSSQKINQARVGIAAAQDVVAGVNLTRDLVNEPGLHATPTQLVKVAQDIASKNPRISIKVFAENQLKKMGANALLAVSRGSAEPAYLIHLTYKPKTTPRKRLALAGKGLTFDAGGLSIKPWEFMKTMKIDMAGAATVLGIFSVLKNRESKHEIHAVIPTTENLISGKAIKPGDVVSAMNGKTIEIVNTDAEGRVILADAFSYLGKQEGKWDALIDFATLTGACVVALGEQVAGLFGNEETLKKKILEASQLEGEPIWELPLVADYKNLIESQIADLANVGKTRWGGAITAALFLKEFVPKDTPWVHLDIAGPAWEEKGEIPYIPKGGTGFAVRTMLRFLDLFS